MADSEREDSYYYPGGVPITPQAQRLGFEFPTYVSKYVWSSYCLARGIASKHGQSTDGRVFKLVQYCYDGMIKALAVSDNFLFFAFKIWYWHRDEPRATKQKRTKLGARLFLDPIDDTPWLYIFDLKYDSINELRKGRVEAPVEEQES